MPDWVDPSDDNKMLPAWDSPPGEGSASSLGNQRRRSGIAAVPESRVPTFARAGSKRRRRTTPRFPIELLGVMVLVVAVGAAGIVIATRGPAVEGTPESVTSQAIVIAPEDSTTAMASPQPASQTVADRTVTGDFEGVVVCLDPGHGGPDRGFVHPGSAAVAAVEEAPLVLLIANELRVELESAGFTVVTTRTTDAPANPKAEDTNRDGIRSAMATPVPGAVVPDDPDETQARIKSCNDAKADILVSLHVRGNEDLSSRGSNVWFSDTQAYAPLSKLLAALIAGETSRQLTAVSYDGPMAAISSIQTGGATASLTPDMRILAPEDAALKEPSQMPAAFAEILTITNDADAFDLEQADVRRAIVLGYRDAIARYAVQMLPTWRGMSDE